MCTQQVQFVPRAAQLAVDCGERMIRLCLVLFENEDFSVGKRPITVSAATLHKAVLHGCPSGLWRYNFGGDTYIVVTHEFTV